MPGDLPDAVIIGKNRIHYRSGRRYPRIRVRTFTHVPAVIRTYLTDVDFFPHVLTDVGDVKVSGRPVEAVAPRIAQTICKDFVGSGLVHERVVGRHGIVGIERVGRKIVRHATHIEAQDLAEQRINILSTAKGVACGTAITEGGVEVPVGSETEPAGLVVGETCLVRLVDGDDQRGARGIGHVCVRRRVIAADHGIAVEVDHIDVKEAITGKVGIEGEAEKAALAVFQNLARDVQKRRCQDLPGGEIEDFDLAGSLDDEQAAGVAGGCAHEYRLGKPGRHARRRDRTRLVVGSIIGIKSVNNIPAGGPEKRVAGVVSLDQVGVGHHSLRNVTS